MTHLRPTGTYYEMWDDGTPSFRKMIQRMQRLGYRVTTQPVERDYQQSQYLGNQPKSL